MSVVEPPGPLEDDEELGVVGVWHALVGQGHVAGRLVRVDEGLVVEVGPVDALAPRPVLARDVSALDEEVRDHLVDLGALEAEAWLKQHNTHVRYTCNC